jgi:hypothetical protein
MAFAIGLHQTDGAGKENLVLTTVLTPALPSEERGKWLPRFGKYQQLDSHDTHSQYQAHSIAVPSPGGEG